MNKIDNIFKKILGKNKKGLDKRSFNFDKILGKTKIGASFKMQNKWKNFNFKQKNFYRKILKDTDRDKVPNIFDCQPYNFFKQEAKYAIPRWLLNQLNPEQQLVAKDMLFNKKMNIGLVADHFEIKHPSAGPRRPFIKMTEQELIEGLQKLGEQLGRQPTARDVNQTSLLPSGMPFKTKFGSFNNALLIAGFKPTSKPRHFDVVGKISDTGEILTRKEVEKKYKQRPEIKKRHVKEQQKYYSNPYKKYQFLKYQKEYRERPEVQEHIKELAKEYSERPEVQKHKKQYMKEYFKKYSEQPKRKEYIQKYKKEQNILKKEGEWEKMTPEQRVDFRENIVEELKLKREQERSEIISSQEQIELVKDIEENVVEPEDQELYQTMLKTFANPISEQEIELENVELRKKRLSDIKESDKFFK